MLFCSLPLFLALAHADPVVVGVDSILFPEEPVDETPPTPWIVSSSRLEIEPGDEHVEVFLEVLVEPVEEGWVDLRLLDGSVRLYDDSEEFVHMGSDGHWWFTEQIDRPTLITLRGSTPRRGDSVSLRTAPGVRQRVQGVGDGLDFEVFGAVGEFLPPSELVEVAWKVHVDEPVAVSRVVQGRVNSAAWIDEGDLRVRSAIRWTVRRGESDRFEVQLPGTLSELEVSGVGLERFDRSGDRLVLTPTESVDGVFEVLVEWRVPFKDKKASLTQPKLTGTATSTGTLTLAGDAELLLSPETKGLRPSALAELPAHARSVGDATPTAAWTGSGTLDLKALQISSLEGPQLVVDRAVCVEASSVGGRNLLRCQLDVRNASRQFLRVQAPEGSVLWAARVNGAGVAPVVVEDGAMAVPLERSVETLSGLTTLDVELTFVGQREAWRERRKSHRSLALPSFDAPVAHLEWELRLPPGFEGEIDGGTARSAGDASTEIVYAVTTGEEKEKEQAARQTWNAALDAYQDNDFEVAQSYIDQTLSLDVDNDNALRLQTNLDVLSGKDTGSAGGGDEAMSRRVKDMAKAKVAEEEYKQADKLEEAERALASGDYERAIEVYEEVEELSKELSRYEQREQNEQAYYGSSSSSGKAEAKKRQSARNDSLAHGSGTSSVGRGATGTSSSGEVAGIEGSVAFHQAAAEPSYDIPPVMDMLPDGTYELISPDGAYLLESVAEPEHVIQSVPGVALGGNANLAGGAYMVLEEHMEVPGDLNGYDDYDEDISIDEIRPYTEADLSDVEVGGRSNFAYAPGVEVIIEEPSEAFDDAEYDFATGTSLVDLVPERSRRVRLEPSPATPEPEARPQSVALDAPVTSSRQQVTTLNMPALSATTLAIPLPDHGSSLSVVQRLLAPGEVPTLEITYREER